MVMAGDGPMAVAVMWVVTALTFVFVVLRIYVRAVIVQNYGIDDHVYVLAFVLLLCYTSFTTVAATYGFGQNMWEVTDIDELVQAILNEAIGQTFAVVGMAVAKWSLGLFLLRLVTETWHKVAIWITMTSLMAASIAVCFVFWLQCTPPAYLFDRRIPGGLVFVIVLCVFADFFFALFPWLFLWKLNMNQREKIIIAASMSLGLIAGACGIKRTVEVPGLVSTNYLKDTVGLIVWSAAEIAVTMICIGIPVIRPLYKKALDRMFSRDSSRGYQKQGGAADESASNNRGYGLRTIGGSAMPGGRSKKGDETDTDSKSRQTSRGDGGDGNSFRDVKLGINGPFTDARAIAGRAAPDDNSDEEILGEEYRTHRARVSDPERGGANPAIQVTEEWRVTRS